MLDIQLFWGILRFVCVGICSAALFVTSKSEMLGWLHYVFVKQCIMPLWSFAGTNQTIWIIATQKRRERKSANVGHTKSLHQNHFYMMLFSHL